MTRKVTATQAKAQILSLLDVAAAGEEVEVTKHGRTVARLVPARGARSLRAQLSGLALSAAGDEELFRTGTTWDVS